MKNSKMKNSKSRSDNSKFKTQNSKFYFFASIAWQAVIATM